MFVSALACENISTLVPVRATAENVRAAMPGTPFMPRPVTEITLTSRIVVTALIAFAPSMCDSCTISVPGWLGLNVFLTRSGILRSMSGAIVIGCSTDAP